jgi:hypothetical protein
MVQIGAASNNLALNYVHSCCPHQQSSLSHTPVAFETQENADDERQPKG